MLASSQIPVLYRNALLPVFFVVFVCNRFVYKVRNLFDGTFKREFATVFNNNSALVHCTLFMKFGAVLVCSQVVGRPSASPVVVLAWCVRQEWTKRSPRSKQCTKVDVFQAPPISDGFIELAELINAHSRSNSWRVNVQLGSCCFLFILIVHKRLVCPQLIVAEKSWGKKFGTIYAFFSVLLPIYDVCGARLQVTVCDLLASFCPPGLALFVSVRQHNFL